MKLRQAELQIEDYHRTCWIDHDIKEGDRIRFVGEELFWDVKKVYNTVIEKNDLNCDWKGRAI